MFALVVLGFLVAYLLVLRGMHKPATPSLLFCNSRVSACISRTPTCELALVI